MSPAAPIPNKMQASEKGTVLHVAEHRPQAAGQIDTVSTTREGQEQAQYTARAGQ